MTAHENLQRRFREVEKLPPPKRKQIVKILGTFLGREKVRKGRVKREPSETGPEGSPALPRYARQEERHA
jgi:hypothetical protein